MPANPVLRPEAEIHRHDTGDRHTATKGRYRTQWLFGLAIGVRGLGGIISAKRAGRNRVALAAPADPAITKAAA